MEWALRWSRVSFEAADGGLKKYMEEYFEFPKFCEEIVQTIQAAGGSCLTVTLADISADT